MSLNDAVKSKSFWERPEGTTGAITLAVAIALLAAFRKPLIDFMGDMITLLGQSIFAMILAGVLGAIVYLATNKKVQTLVGYIFKSAMRKITGLFVEIDPIGIMKSYIEDLIDKRAGMLSSKDKLQGQIIVLERQINENTKGYDNAMLIAKLANDQGKRAAFTINSRQAGRLQKLNKESFQPLLIQMQMHLKAINKYYEVTGTVIDDLTNEVKARQIEREMILASYSAMSTAKKILNGGTDKKEIFDQAMEFVVNDFGAKLGEITSFIESSKGFVEGLDLQNGVYEEEALTRLKEWENHADSILLGSDKQLLVEHSQPVNFMNLGTNNQAMLTPIGPTINYDKLIK